MFEIVAPLLESFKGQANSLGVSPLNLAIILVIAAYLLVVPWVKIFRRVGMSEGFGILMLVPIVNIAVFLIFAYLEWPIERERKHYQVSPIWRT
jgi:hypothetical protein